jgi:hypothetical protein
MAGDDLGFDVGPILEAIETADVLVIRFAFVDQRLLIDVRPSELDPPVIALVPQASGIEERFRSVLLARPRLELPERIISFQWPRHASVMASAGIWDRIRQRFIATGAAGAAARCDKAWAAIEAEEQREAQRAIRGGDRYETLWERSPAAE